MKTVAVIAEYNPFHKGHEYQLQEIRRQTKADYILVLMSGCFVQRGEAAILPPEVRAEAALMSGADLVLSLPVLPSTGAAPDFAEGSVRILEALNLPLTLAFGVEGSRENFFSVLSEYEKLGSRRTISRGISRHKKNGLSYPQAMQEYLKTKGASDALLSAFDSPNLTLALSYAAAREKNLISLLPIPRIGQGERESGRAEEYPSASSIRDALRKGEVFRLENALPSVFQLKALNTFGLPDNEELYPVLRHILLTDEKLHLYRDMKKDAAQRFREAAKRCICYETFFEEALHKGETRASLRRRLLSVYLGIREKDRKKYKEEGVPSAIRILGVKERAFPLLHVLKKNAEPKLCQLARHLPKDDASLRIDERAEALYRNLQELRMGRLFSSPLSKDPLILREE